MLYSAGSGKIDMTNEELLEKIEEQRSLMIAIATGGYQRIENENEGYKEQRQRIRIGLEERQLPDTNPFYDLRRWYDKWSSGKEERKRKRTTWMI